MLIERLLVLGILHLIQRRKKPIYGLGENLAIQKVNTTKREKHNGINIQQDT